MLGIDDFSNCSQNILGILRGVFGGFWCPKGWIFEKGCPNDAKGCLNDAGTG